MTSNNILFTLCQIIEIFFLVVFTCVREMEKVSKVLFAFCLLVYFVSGFTRVIEFKEIKRTKLGFVFVLLEQCYQTSIGRWVFI